MDKEGIHFCKECHNLTFLHLNEEDKLIHACKICGKTELFNETNNCIHTSTFQNYDISLTINQNKYITHDKTLPIIQSNPNLKCPNSDCDPNQRKEPTVFKYIKYNSEDMKYIYICQECGQKWTN